MINFNFFNLILALPILNWSTFLSTTLNFNLIYFPLDHFIFPASLYFATLLYFSGVLGICLNNKNIIILMVFVEIMFLGINLFFIFGSIFLQIPDSQVFTLIILSVAAGEAAVGFGLLIASFRNKPFIVFESYNQLKG